MRTFHRLAVALRSWFSPGAQDAEFGDELRFHLERLIESNLEAGLSPAAARRAAHLSIGHLEGLREESRSARSGAIMRQMLRDVAYGARLLRKAPAFAITGIVIVALGISAVTAIFSVVYGVILRPLPFREPDRLVGLWTQAPRLALVNVQVNAADHREWQASNHVFEDIALVRTIANFNLVGDGEPERLFGARVSSSLFPVLGVTPAIGRTFTEDEDEIGRDNVVLLSDALWRRRFGADPSIVGRTINLSGAPHTVVGVMRPDFQYPGREYQLWTPLTINPDEITRKVSGFNFLAVARLEPGVTLEQAQSEMTTIARRLEVSYPATNREIGVRVVPLMDETLQPVRPALYVLLVAVSCLLLIACLNLSNLLSARAATRGREFAMRVALGASRPRLAVQAIAEVAPVLAFGGAAGVVLAAWAVHAFVPLAPAALPRVESIAISGPVLAFSAAMLMFTGLGAGLLPAMQAWRADSITVMREENRSTAGGRHQSRTRSVLVVAQLALVLPLLVGAALLIRSFSALVEVDPGFRADNVVTLQLAIPRSKYPKDDEVAMFCGRLLERITALPGVVSAGMVNRLPLGGVGQINGLEFEGQGSDRPPVATDTRSVTPDYFRTMGIPLIEGRFFTEHDTAASAVAGLPQLGAVSVAIVDERFARVHWPAQNAIGKRLRFAFPGAPWLEVVGVVGHIRHDGLDVDPRPQVYFNYLQRAQDRMALVVRGAEGAPRLTGAVAQAIREVDPEQPVYDVRTMSDVVDRSTAQRRLSTLLLAAFASMSLLLTTIGVYGVIAYGVTQQIREFGIRMAFGAARSDVTRLVLRRGATLAAGGTLIGLAVAALLTRAMASLLYGVKPGDPVCFVAAPVLLVGVALLASYLPARRAASVDPAITLRGE
jgi:putative ABC transport system permease protein